MAEDRMAVLETVRKAIADGDVDFLREGVRVLAQAVMETEITELTGLPKGERNPERRLTSRNGYRERRWDTRVGTLELSIPRVRDGSYFPSLLEPRRRAERALLAVVQEAYVLGVSTRRVEDLVEALGIAGISKSEVSRICTALDVEVETFRSRPLGSETYPYLWLDATYVKVREAGRVVSMAALARGSGRLAWSVIPRISCDVLGTPGASTACRPGRSEAAGRQTKQNYSGMMEGNAARFVLLLHVSRAGPGSAQRACLSAARHDSRVEPAFRSGPAAPPSIPSLLP